jgi:hypothetical protein
LDDLLSLLSVAAQLVLSVFVPLGVGALIVSVYEQRKRVKERAIDRFCEFVLTNEFFKYLTALQRDYDLFDAYLKVKGGERTLVYMNDSPVMVDTPDVISQEIFRRNTHSLLNSLQEKGVIPMAPPRIRREVVESLEAEIRVSHKLRSGQDFSGDLRHFGLALARLQREIRAVLYQTEL